ncbi:MAG: hypothetical protein GSR84_04720 [Desulfurococcales archaeon]|nr:hypothetical protein [Desulfurococcales archaeon]
MYWLLLILLLSQAPITVNMDQRLVEGRVETRVTIEMPSKLISGRMRACLNGSTLTMEGWAPKLYGATVEVNMTIQGGEARGIITIDTGITRAEARYALATISGEEVVVEAILVPQTSATPGVARNLEEALESLPLVRDARVEEAQRGYRATVTLDISLGELLGPETLAVTGLLERTGNYSLVVEADTRIRVRLLLETVARSWLEAVARDSWIVDPVIQVLDRSRQACINIDIGGIVVEATLLTYLGEDVLPPALLDYLNTTDKLQEGATPTQDTPEGEPIIVEPGYGMILAVSLITLAITGKILWRWARLPPQA